MYLIGLFRSFLSLTIIVLLANICYADKKPVKLIQQWKGSVMNVELMKDAPTYITTPEGLDELWRNWNIPDQKPEVNFAENIVVVVTSRGSVLSLIATLDEAGDMAVHGLGTMDLGPGFRYVIATVSRAGVKTVNGNELLASNKRASVTGTVSYRQRIALPPGAILEVLLLDTSRANEPPLVLTRKEIRPTTQVPISFTLPYDPGKIDESHTYALRARILVKGRVWAMNTLHDRVITQGNPTEVAIIVEMVRYR